MPTIRRADTADVDALAALVWLDTRGTEPSGPELAGFAADLAAWWAGQAGHAAFVAQLDEDVVGAAWLAVQPRVPRPGATARASADVQSVFVRPEHRGGGIGTALVAAAASYAADVGAARVTVHAGRRARPLYERLGFASSPVLLQRPTGPATPAAAAADAG